MGFCLAGGSRPCSGFTVGLFGSLLSDVGGRCLWIEFQSPICFEICDGAPSSVISPARFYGELLDFDY